MTSKEQFIAKKELRAWWKSVVEDPRFSEVMLHTRVELVETYGVESAIGGYKLATLMTSICEPEETGPDMLIHSNPGLHHQPDVIKPKAKKS